MELSLGRHDSVHRAIVRAREKAEKTLGAKFNIRAFHDAVLELGSVPLPVVTARVDRSSQKARQALSGSLPTLRKTKPVSSGATAKSFHGDFDRAEADDIFG